MPARSILARATLPTHLSSAEIRAQWAQRLREQAIFSARATSDAWLQEVRNTLAEIVQGRINLGKAEERLVTLLDSLGYDAAAGGFPGDEGIPPATPGSLRDLASRRRIKLIVDTNEGIATSLSDLARSADPIALLLQPGWRLIPGRYRKAPRPDWDARWQAAGESVGWQGALKNEPAALKTSPIWQALGDGAGGYRDTLGNPYPPFAFNSGLIWLDLSRQECLALGLLEGDAPPLTSHL